MEKTLKYIPLTILGSLLLLLPACSKQKLRLGMEYTTGPSIVQEGGTFLSSSTVYVFTDQGVSVSWIISKEGDVFIRKADGALITGNDPNVRAMGGTAVGGHEQGETLSKEGVPDSQITVVLGPGDRMPILQNAPYRVEGTSVYVDWSKGHSQYFDFSGCSSGSEVFTIKNEGLILESATQPGYTLTMGIQALTPMEQVLHDERQQTLQQLKKLRELRGN